MQVPEQDWQLAELDSQYVELGHVDEHRPLRRRGVAGLQVRHCPSFEQVAHSDGQAMQRRKAASALVPAGQVATQSPDAVAKSVGLAQAVQDVAVRVQALHLLISQAD